MDVLCVINLANNYYEKEQYIEARTTYKLLYTQYKVGNAFITYRYANTFYYTNEFKKCEKIYNSLVVQIINKNLKCNLSIKILNKFVLTLEKLKKFDECIEILVHLINIIKNMNHPIAYGILQLKLINLYIIQNKFIEAEQMCLQLLSNCVNDNINSFYIYNKLTLIYHSLYSLNGSTIYHQKVIYYYNLMLTNYKNLNPNVNDFEIICNLANILNWNNPTHEIDFSKIQDNEFISENDFISVNV